MHAGLEPRRAFNSSSTVPRYYFDFLDGDRAVPDTEGTELPDIEDARTEALAALGGIARDELPDGDDRRFAVTVRDGDGPKLTASLVLHVERAH